MFDWRDMRPFLLLAFLMLGAAVFLVGLHLYGGARYGQVAMIGGSDGGQPAVRQKGGLVVNPVLNVNRPERSVFALEGIKNPSSQGAKLPPTIVGVCGIDIPCVPR